MKPQGIFTLTDEQKKFICSQIEEAICKNAIEYDMRFVSGCTYYDHQYHYDPTGSYAEGDYEVELNGYTITMSVRYDVEWYDEKHFISPSIASNIEVFKDAEYYVADDIDFNELFKN